MEKSVSFDPKYAGMSVEEIREAMAKEAQAEMEEKQALWAEWAKQQGR